MSSFPLQRSYLHRGGEQPLIGETIDAFVRRLGGDPLVFLAGDLVLIAPVLFAELIRSLS